MENEQAITASRIFPERLPRRIRRYTIMLTPDEYEELERRCADKSKFADWIRHALFAYDGNGFNESNGK